MRSVVETKRKVDFIDLVRPTSGSFHPYGFGQAFEVFRWMVKTGQDYVDRGRVTSVYELLSSKPGCVGFREVDSFGGADWKRDLGERFAYAILHKAEDGPVKEWRDRNGISVLGTRILPIRYYSDGTGVGEEQLTALLTTKGETKAWHNDCHKDARTVRTGILRPYSGYWQFSLSYGFADEERMGSRWELDVARQNPGEIFTDFVVRSRQRVGELVDIKK